jgi:hypothetical protein
VGWDARTPPPPPPTPPTAVLVDPSGTPRALPLAARELRLEARAPGIHRVEIGGETLLFAANALDATESDLRGAGAGRWGGGDGEEAVGDWRFREGAWLALLAALAVLLLHLKLFLAPAKDAVTP